jgi:asparagine synthase (glutamine-hydrolysing)
MGFSIPLARWLRGPLKDRLRLSVLGPTLAETGIFDMAFLKEMVEQHLSGRRDNSASLWTVLMFEAFLRNLTRDTRDEWSAGLPQLMKARNPQSFPPPGVTPGH